MQCVSVLVILWLIICTFCTCFMIVRVRQWQRGLVAKLAGAAFGLGVRVRAEVISLSRMSRFVWICAILCYFFYLSPLPRKSYPSIFYPLLGSSLPYPWPTYPYLSQYFLEANRFLFISLDYTYYYDYHYSYILFSTYFI